MGNIKNSNLFLKVISGVALLAMPVAMSGCSSADAVVPTRTDWPTDSLGTMIDEPEFPVAPSSVHDFGRYVTVTYDGVGEADVSAYIDELKRDPNLFVTYDERDSVTSCNLTDNAGNSVSVIRMSIPATGGQSVTSISVVKV